ncbi:MAG: hypothetical protein L6R43_13085 [Planctomycetes bacterium]|nr:hypothetical protein [Planctomycetota bacterium]
MDAIALSCQKCGAALRAEGAERFLTCGFCRSRLEILRSPDSLRTKVLEDLERTNAGLARELEATRLRLALSDLDRDWHAERETLMVRGENGGSFRPRRAWGVLAAVIGVVQTVAWYSIAAGFESRRFPGADVPRDGFAFFPYLGILPAAIGIGVAWYQIARARAYDHALARYEAERADLAARLRAQTGT